MKSMQRFWLLALSLFLITITALSCSKNKPSGGGENGGGGGGGEQAEITLHVEGLDASVQQVVVHFESKSAGVNSTEVSVDLQNGSSSPDKVVQLTNGAEYNVSADVSGYIADIDPKDFTASAGQKISIVYNTIPSDRVLIKLNVTGLDPGDSNRNGKEVKFTSQEGTDTVKQTLTANDDTYNVPLIKGKDYTFTVPAITGYDDITSQKTITAAEGASATIQYKKSTQPDGTKVDVTFKICRDTVNWPYQSPLHINFKSDSDLQSAEFKFSSNFCTDIAKISLVKDDYYAVTVDNVDGYNIKYEPAQTIKADSTTFVTVTYTKMSPLILPTRKVPVVVSMNNCTENCTPPITITFTPRLNSPQKKMGKLTKNVTGTQSIGGNGAFSGNIELVPGTMYDITATSLTSFEGPAINSSPYTVNTGSNAQVTITYTKSGMPPSNDVTVNFQVCSSDDKLQYTQGQNINITFTADDGSGSKSGSFTLNTRDANYCYGNASSLVLDKTKSYTVSVDQPKISEYTASFSPQPLKPGESTSEKILYEAPASQGDADVNVSLKIMDCGSYCSGSAKITFTPNTLSKKMKMKTGALKKGKFKASAKDITLTGDNASGLVSLAIGTTYNISVTDYSSSLPGFTPSVVPSSKSITVKKEGNESVTVTFNQSALPPSSDNPFAGANFYLNPDYQAEMKTFFENNEGYIGKAQKLGLVDSTDINIFTWKISTGVWLDKKSKIDHFGESDDHGIVWNLQEAYKQAQDKNQATTIVFLVYDLPNRDCAAFSSNGEIKLDDKPTAAQVETALNDYKGNYIDKINAKINEFYSKTPEAKGWVRTVLVIEPDSMLNMITNTDYERDPNNHNPIPPKCQDVFNYGIYEKGIAYALDTFSNNPNSIAMYLDMAHSGWLGWVSNANKIPEFFNTNDPSGADRRDPKNHGLGKNFSKIRGFITNTSNYTPLTEHFSYNDYVNMNNQIMMGTYYEWNDAPDEATFITEIMSIGADTKKTNINEHIIKPVSNPLYSNLHFLVDTSRNGWDKIYKDGKVTPATVGTSFKRFDARSHRGNWCNVEDTVDTTHASDVGVVGATFGEYPKADPALMHPAYSNSERLPIDAYVWVKPPGEGDGNYVESNPPTGDQMCASNKYPGGGGDHNGSKPTNSLQSSDSPLVAAPSAGKFFDRAVRVMIDNAMHSADVQPPSGNTVSVQFQVCNDDPSWKQQSLTVNFKATDNSDEQSASFSLSPSSCYGPANVSLVENKSYNVTINDVSGYTASYSPQPIPADSTAFEKITYTKAAAAEPVSVNVSLEIADCSGNECNSTIQFIPQSSIKKMKSKMGGKFNGPKDTVSTDLSSGGNSNVSLYTNTQYSISARPISGYTSSISPSSTIILQPGNIPQVKVTYAKKTVVTGWKGVNWFGFNSGDNMVSGLWSGGPLDGDFDTVVTRIKALGFNAVRLPFSFTEFKKSPARDYYYSYCKPAAIAAIQSSVLRPGTDATGLSVSPLDFLPGFKTDSCNSYLPNTTVRDRYIWVVNFFVKNGFDVLIDNHLREDQTLLEKGVDYWVTEWTDLAKALNAYDATLQDHVMFDLLNEPDNFGLRWETEGKIGITEAYLKAMDALYPIVPKSFFFVEGTGQKGIKANWGDGFTTDKTVIDKYKNDVNPLSDPNPFFEALMSKLYLDRVVLSPHVYPPSVTGNSGEHGSALYDRLTTSFGTLSKQGYCMGDKCHVFPIAVGEFGSRFATEEDKLFLKDFASYLNNTGDADDGKHAKIANWFYWDWNANSGDTGGIVKDDWVTIEWPKIDYLSSFNEKGLDLKPWYMR